MSDIPGFNPDLPSTQAQLARKYTRLGPQLATVPVPILNTAVGLDATRVARNQKPLSGPETIRAIGAAVLNQPITPAPERSSSPLDLLGNFASDIATIGRSIPHLPGAMVNEVRELPEFYDQMQERGFWQAPGIRLLPGAYTANAIAQGNVTEQAMQHPGMTVLDLLPFAKGAKNLPIGGGRTLGQATAATRPAQAVARPIQAVGRAAGATGVGQWAKTSFGADARDVAAMTAQADRLLQEAADPGMAARATGRFSRERPASDLTGTIYDDPTTGTRAADALRRTVEARTTYAHIPADRQAALTELAESGEWQGVIDDLPADEAAYLNYAREMNEELAAIGRTEKDILDFKGEWYDTQTGKALYRGQATVDYATKMRDVRRGIINASDEAASPAALQSLARTVAESDTLSAVRKAEVLRGVSHALDVGGYNGKAIRDALRLTDPQNPARTTLDDVVGAMDEVIGAGPTSPSLTPSQLLDALKPHRRANPNIRLAIANIEAGAFPAARKNLQAVVNARNVDEVVRADVGVLVDEVSAVGQRQRYLARTERYSDDVVEKLTKRQADREARTVPATYMPSVQRKVREGLLERHATDPDFPAIQGYIERGQYSVSPELQRSAEKLTREISGTWKTMKDEGLDPIFVHHVSPQAARAVDFPRVPLTERAPSWAKRRTMDFSPYAKNMSVALNHQALELVSRRGAEAIADNIASTYGRTRFGTTDAGGALDDLYRAKAEAQASVNPTIDVNARIDELINREWTRFDIGSYTPWRQGRSTSMTAGQEVFVPKSVANTLEKVYNPNQYAIQRIVDPVMNVFRTSVLALSPRWHFNNVVGGAMMVAVENPRVFAELPRAIRLMRSGEVTSRATGETITRTGLRRQGAVGTGAGSMPAEVRAWHKTGRLPSARFRATAAHSLYAGRTMRRMLDSGGKVIDKSYALNQFVDDMYRSAIYLRGYEKAARKGMKNVDLADEGLDGVRAMSREAAEQAGMQLTTKIFQNWDRMTPFERNVMRYVFPFYGWMSHVSKFVMRYPVDHPLRATVIGSFARLEQEDLRDRGLPDSFANFFFLGNTDDNGNQKAVSLSAINPFASVGDAFTIAGLTGSMNPIMGAFLTSIGIDPMSGEAELYPDMTYDPTSGRYGVKTPGMWGSLAGSILPQGQFLLSLVGQNAKYKELVKTNPDSAVNMLRSQAGLPVVFRNLPLIETQMKGELVRNEAQTRAFNEALKSGGVGDLEAQYPTLAPAVDRIRQLDESGALDAYRLQQDGPGAPDPGMGPMFYEALVNRNVGSGQARKLGGAYAVQAQVLDRDLPWQ